MFSNNVTLYKLAEQSDRLAVASINLPALANQSFTLYCMECYTLITQCTWSFTSHINTCVCASKTEVTMQLYIA